LTMRRMQRHVGVRGHGRNSRRELQACRAAAAFFGVILAIVAFRASATGFLPPSTGKHRARSIPEVIVKSVIPPAAEVLEPHVGKDAAPDVLSPEAEAALRRVATAQAAQAVEALRTANIGFQRPWQVETLAAAQPAPSNIVGESGSGHILALDESSGSTLLLVLAFLYAVNTPLLKSVEGGETTGIELIMLRFLFCAVPVLPWLAGNFRDAARHICTGVELGCWLWAGYTLQCLALSHCAASTATVIFALCGLMVQTLEAIFDKKPVSMPTLISTSGALAGLGIFVSAPAASGGIETPGVVATTLETTTAPFITMLETVPGEAVCVLGTFFFAVHVWRSAALGVEGGDDSRGAGESDVKLLSLASLQMITAATLAVGLWCLSSSTPVSAKFSNLLSLNSDVWLRMVLCGMLTTSIPHVLELFALRVTPAAKAALIYCTIPVWGVLLSVLVLGEPLSSQASFGGLLIFGCSIPWSTLLPSSGNKENSSIGVFIEAVAPLAALSSTVLTLSPFSKEVVTLGGSTTGANFASQSVAVVAPANQAASQAASGVASEAVSAGPAASVATVAGTANAASSSISTGLDSSAPGVQAVVQSASVVAASAGPVTQVAAGVNIAVEAPAAASVAQQMMAGATSTASAAASPAGQRVTSDAASVAQQMVAGATSTAASAAASPVGQRVTSDAVSTAVSRMAAHAAQTAAPAVQAVSDAASATVASAAASPAGQAAASVASSAASSAIHRPEVASAAAAAAANPVVQAVTEAVFSAEIATAAPAAQAALDTTAAATVAGTVSAASAAGVNAETASAVLAAAAAIMAD